MKPVVMIIGSVDQRAIELLKSVCDVMDGTIAGEKHAQAEFAMMCGYADAVLIANAERVDDVFLKHCRRLRIAAFSFRILEHVDILACSQRGIWVTNVFAGHMGFHAEIEAARNILDALSGDVPRNALNEILSTAA